MTRRRLKGPRSLIRTTTERPFRLWVTRTNVPNGSVRCAAVNRAGWDASPLAVLPPLCEWTAARPDWETSSAGSAAEHTSAISKAASADSELRIILKSPMVLFRKPATRRMVPIVGDQMAISRQVARERAATRKKRAPAGAGARRSLLAFAD